MKIIIIIITLFSGITFAQEPLTPYEKDKLTSTTYSECIDYYNSLAKLSDMIKIQECGTTDIGKPLHLVIISKDKVFDPDEIHRSGKIILFVNNGIHPGEPDGIDACMMLVRDLVASSKPDLSILLDHVVFITIPVYNIDGALNRNNYSRANQIGPKEYGFRGNYENRDLNRDFIKCDTKNARSFIEIFQKWKPELFVDTHTTDGADYTYKMTYIATHPAKLEPVLADYLTSRIIPFLEDDMKKKNMEMCPYVDTYKSTPDSGLVGFLETPRYSTGYAALFNSIGFVSESHMLKTHKERVEASYEFLVSVLNLAANDYQIIKSNKEQADLNTKTKQEFTLTWKVDEASPSKYYFKGYQAKYKKSAVTGFDRMYYDKNSQWEKEINYYDKFTPVAIITKPSAYIIPQAWWQVIELLKLNGVEMKPLDEDQNINVESYYIEKFDTRNPPFEGHYVHSNISLRTEKQNRHFFKGDYIINTGQLSDNFIIHTLEPGATDSYFCWNFFDAILQQKEYFDPYVFEDIADSLLNSKPGLKAEFEKKKREDEKFRNDPNAQLAFIYNNTLREPEFMRYPVGRIVE